MILTRTTAVGDACTRNVINKNNVGKNLRGRSFRAINLTGEDFSHADIRGADFTGAILKNANFGYAKGGLQKHQLFFGLIPLLLLALLSGVLASLGGSTVIISLEPEADGILFTLVSDATVLGCLLVFGITTIHRGFWLGLGLGIVILIPVLILSVILPKNGAEISLAFFDGLEALFLMASSLAAISLSASGIRNTFESRFIPTVVTSGIALISAIIMQEDGGLLASVAISSLGNYIGYKALAEDRNFSWIRSIILSYNSIGGTSFQDADLTNADFTEATLKNTNFINANLNCTRWYGAKKLDHARVGNSILKKASVRDLLVSGNGYKKSYNGINLKGANLTGANLNEANLKEADISQATLQEAYLEGANLTKVQAVGTDFTNAHLTGACLEAWNIDSTTKLQQIDCRYVYLLEQPNPITGDRERRPHDPDKIFALGDFEKVYKKIINTVQILLRNGINREAFAVAFQKLMEENPEITPESIQAIEKKDNDVLLTLEVPEGADKGKIQRTIEEAYEARLEAQKQAALLDAEIRHNKDIKEIILATLVAQQSSNPIFNFTSTATAESKAMNESTDQSRNLSISDMKGDVTGNIILGDNANISGAVSKTINQLPTSPEPDKPGIKELLTQLQAAIEADADLTQEDKAEALEQVKALAEAGQNPQEGTMQKTAKTAMKILKGTVAGLPSAAALVEACNKLLPAIASLLGLA